MGEKHLAVKNTCLASWQCASKRMEGPESIVILFLPMKSANGSRGNAFCGGRSSMSAVVMHSFAATSQPQFSCIGRERFPHCVLSSWWASTIAAVDHDIFENISMPAFGGDSMSGEDAQLCRELKESLSRCEWIL